MSRPEFEYIDWIRARVPQHPAVTLGIGDDAAVLRLATHECVVAVDMLMDGVDFRLGEDRTYDIGRKALAVNLSDLAAMAAQPFAAVVSVALPKNAGLEVAKELHDGIQQLADEFGVGIAGGDTNSWDGPLVISVTVLGAPTGSGPVRRSGARPGDWIFATGAFGGSLLGRHLSFTPRVSEALALHAAVELHAMIDVSDGLAADLHHLLDESNVGAAIRADAIPISEASRNFGDGRSPLEHALGDGEDFELIFTVTPADGRKLESEPPPGVRLSHVGEIKSERGCTIIDASGRQTDLPPLGWVHEMG